MKFNSRSEGSCQIMAPCRGDKVTRALRRLMCCQQVNMSFLKRASGNCYEATKLTLKVMNVTHGLPSPCNLIGTSGKNLQKTFICSHIMPGWFIYFFVKSNQIIKKIKMAVCLGHRTQSLFSPTITKAKVVFARWLWLCAWWKTEDEYLHSISPPKAPEAWLEWTVSNKLYTSI